jgi:hypothetical protein
VRIVLLIFVALCVFDPADVMIGGKVYVFCLLWVLTILHLATSKEEIRISRWLLGYVAIFIAIPTLSIIRYHIYDGREPFDGLLYLKGYLLVTLALVLKFCKIDMIPMLSAVLVPIAIAAIAVFIGVLAHPALLGLLYAPGIKSGLVYLSWRDYGNLTLLQAYFVTSPMLVVPIAYYFDRMMTSDRKLTYLALCAVCIAGMIVAGSRNNLFVALLLPALLWPFYTKYPVPYLALSICAVGLLTLPFLDELHILLNPGETANNVRIGLLRDYGRILSQPSTLLLGKGLGAYETWTATPEGRFASVSELTFLEVIRNFGIPGGAVIMGLLLAPVACLWTVQTKDRALALAYLLYLVMSYSNPILFDSMGILILSALLVRVPATSELTLRWAASKRLTA